jgi:hypothetical protein
MFLLFRTEHRGWVVNIPALYSGYAGFKSQLEDFLSWLRIVMILLSPSK